MSLLIVRTKDVTAHWTDTASALGKILPEVDGQYALQSSADGCEVELTLRGTMVETTNRYTGGIIPVVPFLDVPVSQSSNYWFAWHERWRQPQSGSGQTRLQFSSSSIAIYSGQAGRTKQQVLRAEWAGAAMEKVAGKSVLCFQGDAAAHPHWHFAGIEDEPNAATHGLKEFETAQPAQVGLAAFADATEAADLVQDRTALLEAGDAGRSTGIAPAWARIHLAASARWAQEE